MTTSPDQKIVQLNNISVHYDGVKAVDDVTLALARGEVVALMGPNGAGKSTILKAIFGLTPIDRGQIFLHGQLVTPVPHQVVQQGVSFVPQGRRVFTHLTIDENLDMGGFAVKDKRALAQAKREMLELFPDLKQKRRAKSGTLSGGQQQMLALARGLMTRPQVLLLDEPSLGLAPKIVKEIFVKIREINEMYGTAMIIVEHNIKSLLEIVSRAYVLDKGKILAEGDAQKLSHSEILEKIFLGKLE